MQYDEFVSRVQQQAGLDRADAERVTRAVIETLGERLDEPEREELAPQLPKEFKSLLNMQPRLLAYSVDEFFDRVAERAKIGVRDSMAQSRAVITVLKEATSPEIWSDLYKRLPQDYVTLLK